MQNVAHNRTRHKVPRRHVRAALRERPFMAWWLVPLLAELIQRGYEEWLRAVITFTIEEGGTTAECVAKGWLDPDDQAVAETAIAAGRAGGWLRDAVDDRAPAIAVAREVLRGNH